VQNHGIPLDRVWIYSLASDCGKTSLAVSIKSLCAVVTGMDRDQKVLRTPNWSTLVDTAEIK
jgi:hypothetical protein